MRADSLAVRTPKGQGKGRFNSSSAPHSISSFASASPWRSSPPVPMAQGFALGSKTPSLRGSIADTFL